MNFTSRFTRFALPTGVALLTLAATPAFAQISIYNTGQSTTATPLAGGTVDTHYKIVRASDNTIFNAIVVGDNNHFGEWNNNDAASTWIGLADAVNNESVAGVNTGVYYLRTTFDLTGYNPATATIAGAFRGDDVFQDILLNGSSLTTAGVPNLNIGPNGAWTSDHPFSYSGSLFKSGINTVDFAINFSDNFFDAGRVPNLSVTATPAASAAPESASLPLMLLGMVGGTTVLARRYRRS